MSAYWPVASGPQSRQGTLRRERGGLALGTRPARATPWHLFPRAGG